MEGPRKTVLDKQLSYFEQKTDETRLGWCCEAWGRRGGGGREAPSLQTQKGCKRNNACVTGSEGCWGIFSKSFQRHDVLKSELAWLKKAGVLASFRFLPPAFLPSLPSLPSSILPSEVMYLLEAEKLLLILKTFLAMTRRSDRLHPIPSENSKQQPTNLKGCSH